MHTPKIFLILGVFLLLGVGAYIYNSRGSKQKETHYHAGFQVYKDDKLLVFSDSRYMSLAPCEDDSGKGTPVYEQLQKAHLHDNVGDVVHIHREAATWGDLFKNINFNFEERPKSFINGTEVADFFSYPIKAYDSAVVFMGKATDIESKLKKAVTKDYIVDTENKSRDCGVVEENHK